MILEKIRQKVLSTGITGKELKLLLILLIVLFAGLLIKTFKNAYPQYSRFDYSSVDSVFAKLNETRDSNDIRFLNQPDSAVISELEKRDNPVSKYAELSGQKININSAGLPELKKLPGIGDKIAADIIDYRKNNGFFKSSKSLMEVKGIGPKKYEKIKAFIVLEN